MINHYPYLVKRLFLPKMLFPKKGLGIYITWDDSKHALKEIGLYLFTGTARLNHVLRP